MAYRVIPFVRRAYEPGDNLGQLLQLRGAQQAQAELRRGDTSAQLWANLGNTIGNTIQGVAQAHEAQQVRKQAQDEKDQLNRQDTAFMGLLQKQPNPDPREIIAIYGPQRGMAIASGFHAFTELQSGAVKDARDTAGRLAVGMKASSPQLQKQFWPAIREAAIKGGLGSAEDIPEQSSPEYLDAIIGWSTGKEPAAPAKTPTREVVTTNADGSKTTQIVEDTPGQTFTSAAPPKAVPATVDAAILAAQREGNQGEVDRLLALKRRIEAAGRAPTAGGAAGTDAASDVKEAVTGMKDGTLPPILPGRASKDYTALMAEAHRQGYDLAGAATDWMATQKHISSLNSTQQLRLNEAINQLPELLDSVDALASKWKGGRFPILNRANLALAKNGAYGEDVASVARQLDTQIADVTSDLAVAYMGGNSPTDHALSLAKTALSGDWSEKVLHDMVKLARGNVVIRRNSINNTGVAGASADNPYAPVPPPSAAPVAAPSAVPSYQDYLNSRGAK